MDDETNLELAERYAAEHDTFDSSFIESLRERFDDRGNLSEAQSTALENIVTRFRMIQWGRNQ